jgi:quercetin dioxygenase-like cupin family protein
MSGAVVHEPGGGETLAAGPAQLAIKATSADTGGTFFLSETTLPAGMAGPPLHRHRELHDMFYVLEGTLTFLLGDEARPLGAGSFVCVPPGVAHTFRNDSDAPARFLNFNTPGGFEDYMRELATAMRSPSFTPADIGPIAAKYDFEPV